MGVVQEAVQAFRGTAKESRLPGETGGWPCWHWYGKEGITHRGNPDVSQGKPICLAPKHFNIPSGIPVTGVCC